MSSTALQRFIALRDASIAVSPAAPGLPLCHALSDALDAAIRELLPTEPAGVAVLAIGGYGRREQCLHSDVDLLVLHAGTAPAGLVDALLYPLWDVGLKVGHAVRSVPETVTASAERIETLTALLTPRLLLGSAALVAEMQTALARQLRRGPRGLSDSLTRADAARRAAEPFQLLETNLKNGRGGLRALAGPLWLRRAEAMASSKPNPEAERPELAAAVDIVLSARNALHAVAGRAQDTWLFDLQPAAYAWLRAEPGIWGPRLYEALRALDRYAADWFRRHELAVERSQGRASQVAHSVRTAWRRRGNAATKADSAAPCLPADAMQSVLGYAGMLAATPAGEPRFSAHAEAWIGAASGPNWGAGDRDGLLALLRAGERGRQIFDELDRIGFLNRAMPEWRHVRGAPQYVPFHLHPVDTHLWRTVIEALALTEGVAGETWGRAIAADLGGIDDLLLAALLHDIGKGWPGDHAESGAAAAAALCRRARFDPELALSVTTAVRQHLLLPTIATRRDIADERVIEEVATKAGRVRTLKILYLLSAADSRATGPGIWSPWKASLVRSLFLSALEVLERREGASPLGAATGDDVERVLLSAGGAISDAALRSHLRGMAPGYARAFPPEEILRHLRLMASLPPERDLRLDARTDGAYASVVLTCGDRPGLIALVAGVLALHNLSVLDGRFFTRADGMALQALSVVDALAGPIAEERWQRVHSEVSRALAGDRSLDRRLAEKRHAYRQKSRSGQHTDVRIVAAASTEYTVVEVHAADRVGLLHAIAGAFFRLDLDIHLAKLDKQGLDVVDVFYVRGLDGLPVRDAARLDALRQAVLAALAE